jgi:hypothetical protein
VIVEVWQTDDKMRAGRAGGESAADRASRKAVL